MKERKAPTLGRVQQPGGGDGEGEGQYVRAPAADEGANAPFQQLGGLVAGVCEERTGLRLRLGQVCRVRCYSSSGR